MPLRLSRRHTPWVRLGVFVAALLLFVGGYYWGHRHRQVPEPMGLEAAVRLRPPLPLPEFAARTTPGDLPLGRPWLLGRWSLLHLAPAAESDARAHLALLTRLHNRLGGPGPARDGVQFLLLSPAGTESPPAGGFPTLIRAQAEGEGLAPLLAALGINATADGAAPLYLVDPEAQAVAVFTTAQDAATIARDMQRFLDAEAAR